MINCQKIKNHFEVHGWKYVTVILGVSFANTAFCDTTDPLKAIIEPEVSAMFGPKSTVAYYIYVGEIVLGAITYAKNKNPLILLGVPILVLFTSGMFTYIAPTS